jgi:ribosome recycling factor
MMHVVRRMMVLHRIVCARALCAAAAKNNKRGGKPAASASKVSNLREDTFSLPDHDEEEDVLVDVDQLILKYAQLMSKATEHYAQSANTLRIGQVDPNMFEHVKVKAYGDLMPFKAVAQTVVKSQNIVIVNVHDRSLLNSVSDAIQRDNPDLTPDNDGSKLSVSIPKPTVSQRDALVKKLAERAESTKIHIRKLRAALMKKMDKIEMPEDDRKRWEVDVQDAVNKSNAAIQKTKTKKQEQLTSVAVIAD